MQILFNDYIFKVYSYYNDFWKANHERIDQLPLMKGGPLHIILITVLYVWFSTRVGPRWMKDKKPFDLRPALLTYNLTMVLINAFIFYKAAIFTNFGIYPWSCSLWGNSNKISDKEIKEIFSLSWLFFFSKFLDLLDTVFFVLRKKDQQLSKLHLIHHGLMPIMCFLGLKKIANMSAGLVPFLNSFVHTVMYFYYALSAMKIHVWWKKYLTQLQIGQLIIVVFHSLYFSMFSSCELYPSHYAYPIGILTFLLLVLFGNFFYQSYIKNSNKNINLTQINFCQKNIIDKKNN